MANFRTRKLERIEEELTDLLKDLDFGLGQKPCPVCGTYRAQDIPEEKARIEVENALVMVRHWKKQPWAQSSQ